MQIKIKTKALSLLCIGLLACSVQIKANLETMNRAFETVNDMLDSYRDVGVYEETSLFRAMYKVLGQESQSESSSSSVPGMLEGKGAYYVILMNINIGLRTSNRSEFYKNLLMNFRKYQVSFSSIVEDGWYSITVEGMRIYKHTERLKILEQLIISSKDEGKDEVKASTLSVYFLDKGSVFSDCYHKQLKKPVQEFVKNCSTDFCMKEEIDKINALLEDPDFGPDSDADLALAGVV